MEQYWTWDGSIIRGDDGRFHLFASRWPKKYPMHPSWLFTSEIVRATAPRIEGPYAFEEIVLPSRDTRYFDGRMTHNPSIRRVGDRFLLFYIGATYTEDFPDDPAKAPGPQDPWYRQVWLRKRIGLAWSDSIHGPWNRPDKPILEPRPDFWDAGITSNPSPWVAPDGSIYLAYKSSREEGRGFNIGIARAEHWEAPFKRLSDEPCFHFDSPDKFVEDPFLWHAGGRFHLLLKDMSGSLAGEFGNGVYAYSENAVDWHFGSPAICHARTIPWADGEREEVSNLERLQLLFGADGVPSHLIAATARATGNLKRVTDAWVTIIPLMTL